MTEADFKRSPKLTLRVLSVGAVGFALLLAPLLEGAASIQQAATLLPLAFAGFLGALCFLSTPARITWHARLLKARCLFRRTRSFSGQTTRIERGSGLRVYGWSALASVVLAAAFQGSAGFLSWTCLIPLALVVSTSCEHYDLCEGGRRVRVYPWLFEDGALLEERFLELIRRQEGGAVAVAPAQPDLAPALASLLARRAPALTQRQGARLAVSLGRR